MDYIELFQNLRTNNKYGRKSPHKAVLMLTVIELYEQNVLSDNEIYYDDTLKTMFLKVWNKVLPEEPLFHPEAYLPFWYLQSDAFWHIVPNRGKEDILSLMRDTNIKPSEAKLIDCVKYAELDDDLYFLMTLPSGRSSLKRALLETYTNLSERQIDRMSESIDNAIDYSTSALSDYEKILSNEKDTKNLVSVETDNELVRHFQSLNEDIQIVLNLQYYSFLKSHRSERVMFKEICPTVYDLLDKIVHPIHQSDITLSFAFTYDNFLSDLKIALMSEEGSMELIDRIGETIDILRGNNNNVEITKPIVETKNEETAISDIKTSSYDDEKDKPSQDYFIENERNRCYIIDNRGERVFSSDGELIRLNGIFYKINYTDSFVSMFIIQEDSKRKFSYGRRILSVHSRSPLYGRLDKRNYLKQFKAVKYDDGCDEYYIQVDDRWYGSSGYYADLNRSDNILTTNVASVSEPESSSDVLEVEHVFLDRLGNVIEKKNSSSFDIPETGFAKENRRGKPWTNYEEELIALYFRQGKDAATIAEIVGRTEVSIKSRLGLLGLIDYKYGQESETANRLDNSNSSTQDNTEISIDYSKFTVKIGDILRLLPSQIVVEVIRLRVDNKGYRKIVVETEDEQIVEIYDNQYLYEKISSRKVTTQRSRPRVNVNDSISLEPKKKCKADIGKWIRWKPTSDVGKVVGFKSLGSLQKLVLRRKDGSEIEVYDNPKAYEIIM